MKASSFSFEFFPPRTQEGEEKLKTTLKNLSEFNPEFFSVTFGAGGSTKDKTIGIVQSIKDQGYSAVPHISCITSTKDEVLELITSYKNKGIDRLVALRGDNPSGIAGYGLVVKLKRSWSRLLELGVMLRLLMLLKVSVKKPSCCITTSLLTQSVKLAEPVHQVVVR